jgi:hypothetical protein
MGLCCFTNCCVVIEKLKRFANRDILESLKDNVLEGMTIDIIGTITSIGNYEIIVAMEGEINDKMYN